MRMHHPADIAIYPTDLELLQRVLIRYCSERRCSLDSAMANDAACELMALFQAGIEDEGELERIISRHDMPLRMVG
ncbi:MULTISPECIES: hypothetical protein [unclassified Mesorhizobium]|uniref:hypothetical protein n=1 Tax=unclassified Mesorhizobium TaxID=325217 RepID=UPI00112E782A|nr:MULTISPECIES: hypothetical protein [unclassified Mesorhizobium]MBZ9894290.1 hypothetical protein [Mesorhizobium sp. BR1-1-6]TPL23573.1 hypothetical protein FJ945_17010 [Mesorhizobium sp. B2-4-9]TPM55745.1 hypothetical protein FJ965_30910 [Mesorhizobium sp. B2-2-1]TPM57745.1 hypothetical protein FJ959_13385 [Mesorhizobium sp. B2-2-4]TPN29685.1 hypothetical protein FJ979_31600 [Mesorhizobium sp. B1-1-6]